MATQRDTFIHHDLIANAKPGTVLMVSEPIMIQYMKRDDHQLHQAEAGLFLRIKFNGGGLWCEAAIDGQVITVVVNNEDFGSLDFVKNGL